MRVRSLLLAALPALIAPAAPAPDRAWHAAPAFTADPAALLREAQGIPVKEGVGVQELFEAVDMVLDEQGRRSTRIRYVYRVDQASALENWNAVDAVWEPWHEERPQMRARVITPDGAQHTLDQATIGEFPANGSSLKLYDDRKRLAAPLPQMAVGALAEVEIFYKETSPVFKGGSRAGFRLQLSVPVGHYRCTVEAPESLGLRWKVRDAPGVKPVRTVIKGIVRLVLDLGPLEAAREEEPYEDPQSNPRPAFLVTTFPSWGAVAAGYAEVVERQIAGADVGAWAAAAVAGATEPRAKINRLLSRMAREIRYTGVEFSEASLVPHTPAETLARGYGDCKDKASLLVALLRTQGIPAQVALLSTGPGRDVDPDMPGIQTFDHAIVFVPGPAPLWIDPTVEAARAGDLPMQDQGRRALVAAPGTTGLTPTPQTAPGENLSVEIREIFVADSGPGRILETSQPEGPADMHLRSQFAVRDDPKTRRDNLKKYVKSAYGAKELGAVTLSDGGDLGTPFTLKVEALESTMVNTGDVDAWVSVNVWGMTNTLRKIIAADGGSDNPAPARKRDLLFPDPHAVEWRYRLVPPAGYALRAVPPGEVVTFGPATLASTYELKPDGALWGTFRLDTVKRLWTAAEVDTARESFVAFGKAAPISVMFDQTAEAHLAAGRIKEAIQAARALATAQPAKGGPQAHLARALLRGGMGEAARTAARKATELEPTSAFAWRTLGWMLSNDLVGRHQHAGWDRAGALAAYERAKALDPKDTIARTQVAVLNEANAEGERYGEGATLERAAQEIRDYRKDLKLEDLNNNLLHDLARLGRLEEALTFVKGVPVSAARSAWLTALLLRMKEPRQAQEEVAQAIPDPGLRRSALLAAAEILLPLRRYQEASQALNAGAPGAEDPAATRSRADVLAKTVRHEDLAMEAGAPETVVKRLLIALLDDAKGPKDLTPFFTPGFIAAQGGAKGLDTMAAAARSSLQVTPIAGLPPVVTLDVLLSLSQVTLAPGGSPALGQRVRIQTSSGEVSTWYVAQIKGQYQVAAMDERFSALGVEAMRRLEAKDLEGARLWLDWARETRRTPAADDPMGSHAIVHFWTVGQQAGPEEVRLAAAVIMAWNRHCPQALPVVVAAQAKAPEGQARLRFDYVLASTYQEQKNWSALEPVLRRLLAAYPAAKPPVHAMYSLLINGGRWQELLAFCDAQAALHPDDLDSERNRMTAFTGLGRPADRERVNQALVAGGKANANDFNNLAWSFLVRGEAPDRALDFARRSLLMVPGNSAAQHTLASILAERGETTASLEMLRKVLASEDSPSPREEEWYVFGRIAEQFGEKEAAKACYLRLKEPKEALARPESCYVLAQRRLALM